MSSNFRLKLLAAAIGMATAASLSATPATSGVSNFATVRHATELRNGDAVVGPLAFSQPLHVVIALKLQNKSQLDAYVANPKNKPLTATEFAAQYAPSQAQAQAVADYLKQSGFTNVTIAPNRMLVEADGHADTAQAAFNTSFVHVHTHDGRDAYANASDVMIPASIQGQVLSVLGVENVHVSHIFARRMTSGGAHPDATGTAVGHNPTDFPKIYGASSLPTASTITVGNVVSGQMSDVLSDVKSFESTNGLPAIVPSIEGPGDTGSVSASGDGEWDLDSQDILAMTGGVKSLIFYDAASLSDAALTTDYNLAVTDNTAKVINVSLGECETDAKSAGTTTAEDQVFEQAVAQGQTFSVSAGDSGADECGTGGTTPSWPASSQYVIAAGGTELYTTGTTTWASETVWNNLSENEGATGGSPSTFEPIPSWQKGVAGITNQTYRGVPDIAFDASPDSGALVTVDGQTNQQIGGTSLASPLFVGAWARIEAANGGTLGFAAPLIYKAAGANYAADFHDITSGNNSGETAGTGWDYTTGWGSLIINELSSNINGGSTTGDPVASFTDSVSGLTVSFTNTSTDTGGTISTYAWTFGDGSTSTSASPSHTYSAAGTYTVTLEVTDNTGATSTKTGSVTVSAAAGGDPVASFTDTTSGLTATFTNTSTDTGGTIDAYAWNFGDGSTSTSASPSHTYAAAGTYTVSLEVTDNTGATSTKSGSVTVSSSAPTQLLVNTGFETGKATPWTLTAGVLCSTSTSSSSYCGSGETSHAGSWFAWLDGYGASHTDTVAQTVAIPSGKSTATLQYYLHIDSTKKTAVDTFTVQVLNSSGTVLSTLATFTSLNTNTGYAVETANLAPYIGQTVTIKFTGKETSSSGNTDFTLDDVTLTVQ